ncbi:unnamed protein product [Arctogadus glacialis]
MVRSRPLIQAYQALRSREGDDETATYQSTHIAALRHDALNDHPEHNSTVLGQMFEGNQLRSNPFRSNQLYAVSDEPHVILPIPPKTGV